MRYRLSIDHSLWEWTAKGQHVIPTDQAVQILSDIDTTQARAWITLIVAAIPGDRKTMRDRLQTLSNRNWATDRL